MNNKIQTPYAVSKFEEAVRTQEIRGTFPPEQWDEIDFAYRLRKRKLLDYIKQLEKKHYKFGYEDGKLGISKYE